jgi:Tol biopolymer transport system component
MRNIACVFVGLVLAGALMLANPPAQRSRSAEVLLGQALHQEEVEGNLEAAIATYKKVLAEYPNNRPLAAKALVQMGECYEKLGKDEARRAYELVLREYADQNEAAEQARTRLAALRKAAGAGKPPTLTTRQVWAGPSKDLLGAPSPDGRYLTIQDWESQDLAIRDLTTGQKRRLTNKDPRSLEFAMLSVPSPDGKEVAYCWYNKDNLYDLRVVGLKGSEPRVLYANADVSYLVPSDWSPDGKNVLAILNWKDRSSQLVLVSVTDGSVRVLRTFNRESPWRARSSPDGHYIAYDFPQRAGSNARDIFLLAMDGGREMPLVQHPANDVFFGWTPDGKRILFGSDRSGTMGAWCVQIADGKPQGKPEMLKSDFGLDVRPLGFTRDGSLYYSVRTGMRDVYIAEIDLETGRLLTAPRPATQRFVGSNSRPDWSSDGRRLLYLSHRGPGVWGARAMCVRDSESGEIRELPSKLDRIVDARWFPDARSVLVAAEHPSGKFGPFRIDVQTGDFTPVDLKPLGWGVAFSPDGKTLFYHSAKTASIVARDLTTGREKVLYTIAKSLHYCAGVTISRDGQMLVFAVRDGKSREGVIKVLPVAGGETRDLVRSAQMPFPASVSWTPDGRGVLFVKQPRPDDLKTELWLVSAQGGEPRKLDLTAEQMQGLTVNPDGRHIAYVAGEDRQEVWVMENFLLGLKAAR